jgi:hypothetical protein
MKIWIAAFAVLAASGNALALAQDVPRNAPPSSVKRAQQGRQSAVASPVGHLQPRAGAEPESGANNPGNLDAQDRELDRMIKGICKGC